MLLKGHHPPPPTQDQARMQTADWELFTRTDSASDGGISFEDLVSSSETIGIEIITEETRVGGKVS